MWFLIISFWFFPFVVSYVCTFIIFLCCRCNWAYGRCASALITKDWTELNWIITCRYFIALRSVKFNSFLKRFVSFQVTQFCHIWRLSCTRTYHADVLRRQYKFLFPYTKLLYIKVLSYTAWNIKSNNLPSATCLCIALWVTPANDFHFPRWWYQYILNLRDNL
jgi:hypothetical protein